MEEVETKTFTIQQFHIITTPSSPSIYDAILRLRAKVLQNSEITSDPNVSESFQI